VPQGASAGQTVRVKAPSGQQVDVVLPRGSGPGQQLVVEVDGSLTAATAAQGGDAARLLSEVAELVRSAGDAAHNSLGQLRQRLNDELELQRALWASELETGGRGPQEGGSLIESFIRGGFLGAGGLLGASSLAVASTDLELSQTQALVLAAGEAGDVKQLLAALSEARKVSAVPLSLEEAARNLGAVEEAAVTWRCLLDALKAQDRHDIEVWLEQARGLGLQVPTGIEQVLEELRGQEARFLEGFEKRRDAEMRLTFALEAGDLDLLAEVLAEAEDLGLSDTTSVRKATERLRGRVSGASQHRRPAASSSVGPGPSPPSASQSAAPQRAGDQAVPPRVHATRTTPSGFSEEGSWRVGSGIGGFFSGNAGGGSTSGSRSASREAPKAQFDQFWGHRPADNEPARDWRCPAGAATPSSSAGASFLGAETVLEAVGGREL